VGPPDTIDAGITNEVGTQPEEVVCVPGGHPVPTLVYGQEEAELGQDAEAVEFELDA